MRKRRTTGWLCIRWMRRLTEPPTGLTVIRRDIDGGKMMSQTNLFGVFRTRIRASETGSATVTAASRANSPTVSSKRSVFNYRSAQATNVPPPKKILARFWLNINYVYLFNCDPLRLLQLFCFFTIFSVECRQTSFFSVIHKIDEMAYPCETK